MITVNEWFVDESGTRSLRLSWNKTTVSVCWALQSLLIVFRHKNIALCAQLLGFELWRRTDGRPCCNESSVPAGNVQPAVVALWAKALASACCAWHWINGLGSVTCHAGTFTAAYVHALRLISRAGKRFSGVLYDLWPSVNIEFSDAQSLLTVRVPGWRADLRPYQHSLDLILSSTTNRLLMDGMSLSFMSALRRQYPRLIYWLIMQNF